MRKDFKHLCLASTTISGEGIYAEYTYNGDKQELYIIYFELLRRGYDVAIGKIDNQEVDFIATKTDEKKYVQVTESMNSPETRERELAPLRKIRDSYEKIVIALECNLTQTQDGIKIIRALDFLLE